jgi:hypothetical protein
VTVPDNQDQRPELEHNAAHAARLALCKTQKERIEYACEVLANPRYLFRSS